MSERVILERGVPVPLRDGTILMADVYRPDDDAQHPVLMQRLPYDRTLGLLAWLSADPTKLAQAGYAVVFQDVRGRFGSAGEFVPYAGEGPDGYDSIQWAASQPWSNGAVGMYGPSYLGGVQWLAAAEGPSALGAIAPAMSPVDLGDLHMHRGGALQLGLAAAWHMISVAPHQLLRKLASDIPQLMAELPGLIADIDGLDELVKRVPLTPFPALDDRAGGLTPWLAEMLTDESVARTQEAGPLHERVAVPAMHIAGWYDLLLQSELDQFVAMKSRAATEEARRLTRIIVGPWAHPPPGFVNQVGDIDFGFRASGMLLDLREDLTALHRRWFDARLRGIASGIDEEPPVKLFVMGTNRWRSEDAWPLARARAQRWHVHGDGTFSERPPADAEPSVFTLDPDDPVPTVGGNLLMTSKYVRGPRDQAVVEQRSDVLTFTSEVLTQALEVTGRVRFVCWVAADTVDTDVVARLCDVHPDGRSYNVVDGILRLRFRDGLANPTPLTPGEVVKVEIDLWSTCQVFMPGHRLRLQVRASDFPRYDRCPGNGESSGTAKQILPQRNRLFHDPQRPSHVELPVVSS